jgi:hypothetical protein
MHLKKTDKQRDGSALLFALGIALVLSLTLGGYFYLTISDRTLAARSLAWNSAIPVAEAGIEEAMTQLYYTGTNHLTTNNWTLGGDGWYHKKGTLPSGSFYDTAIQPGAYPTIWSTGCVAAPFGTNIYIKRLVKVATQNSPTFGGGITAKGQITLTGGATADSFDGSQGPYNPATATANVTVLSNGNVAGIIGMSGGGTIHGNAVTGPSGTVTGGTVTGTISHDANVQINDPALPAGFSTGSYATSLPAGSVNGTNYTYVAGTGNYEISTLTIQAGKSMVVNGNAVIYVTSTANNSLVVGGSGFIYLAPGGHLALYLGGPSTISGQGMVNGNQRASDCFIYGLPTCTAMTYSGGSVFYGVVDVPEADFKFTGGTGAAGSFTANTVLISGSGGVHYDTSLGGPIGFVVRSWNEMPVQ